MIAIKALIQPVYVQNIVITANYTSTNAITIIDKCTLTNIDSTANILVSLYLVPYCETAGTAHRILYRTILPYEAYLCPEIVGHVLNVGDMLSTLGTSADKIILRMSGRVLTL